MGELTDKIKGNVNEAIGKAKQAIAEEQTKQAETTRGRQSAWALEAECLAS